MPYFRLTPICVLALLCASASAENLEKAEKKQLEAQAKEIVAEAKTLEGSGKLVEARTKYAESQAMIETHDAADAIKRIDDSIRKQVKNVLSESRKLYESRKYKEAAAELEEGMKLGASEGVLAADLALCYYQLGDREKAHEYIGVARIATPDPKQKERFSELLTFFTTGESGKALTEDAEAQINQVNRLADSIGIGASLEDGVGEEEEAFSNADSVSSQGTAEKAPEKLSHAALKADLSPNRGSISYVGKTSSFCTSLADQKSTLTESASAIFNQASCAETNGRMKEAVSLFQKYLEMAPTALDAKEVKLRIDELQELVAWPDQNAKEIRHLHSAAYAYLAERKYDRALTAFTKATDVAPEFPLSRWRLALLYEMMGDAKHARENFTRFQQLTAVESEKEEANLHLTTLDAKREKYDEEVGEAEDILSELFSRGMNLTFNLDENRRKIRAKRAQIKKKQQRKAYQNRVGGFAVPFPYAQQELARASEHLKIALALFPLAPEANELMGLVFLQANDGHAAIQSYDAVASQNLPVAFYAEMRTRKTDRAVKCELMRDHVRLIFLSSYDKKGNTAPPDRPAGEDGLGDLTLSDSDDHQGFESLDIKPGEIKKLQTMRGLIGVKLVKDEFILSPIYLPSYTPVDGPPGRRFANNYTRLFIRYPGLENSKLGAEGMTGGEKFAMGVNLATSGLDIATNLNPIGSIQATRDAISIARTIHDAVSSLHVNFASWERTVDEQQQLLNGPSFKAIPTEPVSLGFVL